MKYTLIRAVALALSLLMLIPAFIACSDTASADDNNKANINTPVSDTDTDESTTKIYRDNVTTKDYEKYKFRIYSRDDTWFNGNICVDALTGEGVNDSIFERNLAVSERFNIVITETLSTNTDVARNTVLANEDAYDMINARCTAALNMAVEGILLEVSDLQNIDLTRPYWDQSLTKDLSLGSYCYFAVGDISLTFYDYTSVLLFNKQLIEDLGLKTPYDLVNANEWTLDKYNELSVAGIEDVNGDGKMNDKDKYGTIGTPNFVGYTLMLASGVKSVNKDPENYPVYEVATDSKFIEVFEKVMQIMWDSDQWMKTTISDQISSVFVNMFKNNQAIFFSTNFFNVERLRDMDTEFGIIPFPKYDANQANYITRISFFDMFTVPITVRDSDRTSAIIEALTCESKNKVIPAYYEIALKTRSARDEESQAMLDIIMANRVIDCGDTIWVDSIRDTWIVGMFSGNNRQIVSKATGYTRALNKQFETLMTKLEKNSLK